MSVIVKGMEMPKSCDNCWALDDYGDYPRCRITEEQRGYNFPIRDKRMDKCPLVEIKPHGRLIDADLLFQHILLTNGNLYANVIKTDFLDIMPTIIEAEYPPSIPFDKMWKDLKKQDPFFVEVEEEVKKLKAEGKL